MIDTIIGNIDQDLLRAAKNDNGSGKVGLAIRAISDALVKSNIRMFSSRFYFFNGQIYEPLNKLDGIIMNVLNRIDETGKMSGRHASITSGVWKSVSMNELNVDNNLICFRNCVLNMHTEEVMPFSPDYHVISRLDYDYMPGLKPVLWLDFLHDVLEDEDSISVLQKFLGAIFLDRRKVKIETILFLLGSGANGKSVVFDTVMGVLGTSNVSNYEITDLTNSADRGKNLIDINGKLLNYCSEVSPKGFSSSSFKSIVSGEPQQARPIYGMPMKVENIPLIMANANTMPSYKDVSNGVLRRVIILPFNKRISEKDQDKELGFKMRDEYPAIMNWILDGRRRIAADNYIITPSKSAQMAMEEYRGDNNSVYFFLEDKGYSETGCGDMIQVKSGDLYEEYAEYCRASSLSIENIKAFGMTLRNIGFEKVRKSSGVVYNIYLT